MTEEEKLKNDSVTPEEEPEKDPEESTEPSEIEKLTAELESQKDKYLRLMAEYDNYRKRSVKERQEIYPEATALAVSAFLPLADNLERAANAETQDEKYKAGVMMILDQLNGVFKKLGVEEISRTGEEFDPNLENAVNQIENKDLPANTVAQVYQKGYKIGDKVLRHAMVGVTA